ncbi:Patatin-like phospholipase family protein [Oceaniovalibus guishaninsula JLT2003]|uniref:Patatin-like phospholipase family protein n=1 Tax=Oceaniovalibus guishaninsula JLT2003 TaxID=1231392 RepID=K2GNA4_9RHOB|nr:patatin-like phospholipase family protein [Oceaniovalibus guishaninsula]EKE44121.1 Patatin-like phospholipase family protein [Oceaniovalibus guishaninsula JLT2003]
MARLTPPYDQLVFSGGGTRCFWQGGLLHVLRDAIGLDPARIAGVSGGALSACGFISRRGTVVRETMIEAFKDQDRNLPLHEPFDGEPGNSPHQQIYRKVVETVLDADAQRRIANGPAFEIVIARPPDSNWAKLSATAVMAAYEADLAVRSTPHLSWAEKAGLTPERVDARAAAAEGRLIDLVCAAATIPPAFDPPLWDGKPAIDAGMTDQAPVPQPDEGTTLILLTRRFRNIPDIPGRTYLQPQDEVPADKIDFTDPDKLRRTWAMGEDAARALLADMD